MPIQDTLQRFIFEQASIRGEYIHLQESFQTIVNQNDYPPALQQLLGEALCVAGLLSAIIKFDGRLTVQFRGKGKLKLLIAQCDNHLRLRALAKWEGNMSYSDLMEAFKEGVLVIMVDAGPNKSRYQGIVSWRGGSLVNSIEDYFKNSEQLATKIWLGVNDTSAAGFLLQVIPGDKDDLLNSENEEQNSHWQHVTQITSNLLLNDMLHMDCTSLLKILYPEEEIRLFPSTTVAFGCTCSRQRSADAISLLGQQEAEEELEGKQRIRVTCDFCNQAYDFDKVDVADIFKKQGNPPTDAHLH